MKYVRYVGISTGILISLMYVFFGAVRASAVNEQVKTNENFVGSSAAPVVSPIDFPFSVYIGDSLLGVPNPIKALYFTLSGVYIGGGTMALMIDSDATTTKSFIFPNVVRPTPFEFVYRDNKKFINPTSAGAYAHIFNIVPSGLTISGLGVRNTLSYEHALPACPDGLPVNEKIKTSDFFVGNSPSSISGPINFPFPVYIGDNISGIPNSIKSLYFTVSGLYTQGGTMTMMIDGNATTTKSFIFPNVVRPTPFEFIYRDDKNIINPTSAGAYVHTLNITPSGLTISGLGIISRETHRYKPEVCVTYPATGEIFSSVFESTGLVNGPAYNSIMWKGRLGGRNFDTGKVRFQFAAADCANGATNAPVCDFGIDSWNFIGGANCISGDWFDTPGISTPDTPIEMIGASCHSAWNNKRYFRYKVQICSADDCITSGSPSTPTVNDIIVNWSP